MADEVFDPENERPWKPGSHIAGRYDLERRIGIGAMGEVWLAKDRLLAKEVALKVLQGQLAQKRETVRRFHREVALAHSVTHPNVVRIYDTGEEYGQPFFTMEFLAGKTLDDLLETSEGERLPFDEIRAITFDVLDAIEAAHRVGVVHRDLKPANVMLTHRGAIVMDFGVAGIDEVPERAPSASGIFSLVRTEAGTIFGSPAYMAPELWEGEAASVQSDIYAFGVMLYQMITGRLPYEAKTPAAYLQKLSAGRPPPIRSLRRDAPWNLVRLAGHCMAQDAADRPTSASAAATLISPLRSRNRRQIAISFAVAALLGIGALVFRAKPTWAEYGLPDAVAEADLGSAVRAYDVGDLDASLRGLDRLGDRAPNSAAVAFWRATLLTELGDEARRKEACVEGTWQGSKEWKEVAQAACAPSYTLAPSILATLDAHGGEFRSELLPLAIVRDLVPRIEAVPDDSESRTAGEELLERMDDEPDWSPYWALQTRWQLARVDLLMALGKPGEAQDRLAELAQDLPRAPIIQARAAFFAELHGDREHAERLAGAAGRGDPSASLRHLLHAGKLDVAWTEIQRQERSARFQSLRRLWCGYAQRFEVTTRPPRCEDLPASLAAAMWGEAVPTEALSRIELAVVERKQQIALGQCRPSRDVAALTHAPPPYETLLAELEIEAALCHRDRGQADPTRAAELAAQLTNVAGSDPWVMLIGARVDEALDSSKVADAKRTAVAELWRNADAHLPLVGRLREPEERAAERPVARREE